METFAGGKDIYVGIESEAIRMNREGSFSISPHPFPPEMEQYAMDFSQSQLEVITVPLKGAQNAIRELRNHFSYAADNMNGETLWPFSMPPELPAEEDIPIAYAQGGYENREKYLYRLGLATRYGKARQLICGVHINLSAGPGLLRKLICGTVDIASVDNLYLKAARGMLQYMDVLVLLTGASPVALSRFPCITSRRPVISLRNGGSGYAGDRYQSYFDVSSADRYWKSLSAALNTRSEEFHRLKLMADGRVIQLSDRVFQSEKEFYAPVRLKRSTGPYGNSVLYLEFRIFDRDPFVPEGIDVLTLGFVELLFYWSLTRNEDESFDLEQSLKDRTLAAEFPLDSLTTYRAPDVDKVFEKGKRLIGLLEPIARSFDAGADGAVYLESIRHMAELLDEPYKLPSLRVYEDYLASGTSWTEFGSTFSAARKQEEVHELFYTRV